MYKLKLPCVIGENQGFFKWFLFIDTNTSNRQLHSLLDGNLNNVKYFQMRQTKLNSIDFVLTGAISVENGKIHYAQFAFNVNVNFNTYNRYFVYIYIFYEYFPF